jgi:hypothetical protein
VVVTVDEGGPYLPPGLLLFGAFIARVLEDDDNAAMSPMAPTSW